MISLAGRDILHAWGKFIFTGIGLGLLIGVTLTMAGVYRGMVDDGKVLLDNSGANLWVVQKDTLGPYAESSSIPDDLWRSGAHIVLETFDGLTAAVLVEDFLVVLPDPELVFAPPLTFSFCPTSMV